MRLDASVLRAHLRRQNPSLYLLTRFFEADTREGLEALHLFVEILNRSVDSVGSRQEALSTVQDLENLFCNGVTHIPLYEQTRLCHLIETHPNFGLAWEAWCSLEEAYELPRRLALDFIEGLQFDSENRRPDDLEALLKYVFLSGGVLGAAVSRILSVNVAFVQSVVDAASSARLTTLNRNLRRDLELGKDRVPSDLGSFPAPIAQTPSIVFTALAEILYRSFCDSRSKLNFKHRILFSIALVVHRELDRPWYSKLDQVVDSILRISALHVFDFFKRSKQTDGSSVTGTVDSVLALKNQSLRISRDFKLPIMSKRSNDHTRDRPSTFR